MCEEEATHENEVTNIPEKSLAELDFLILTLALAPVLALVLVVVLVRLKVRLGMVMLVLLGTLPCHLVDLSGDLQICEFPSDIRPLSVKQDIMVVS